jgi:hypothetical protein
MELIERYLEAVKFWLPRRQKDDIIAELSGDIYAQIEDREASLNRKLTEAEVEELLKQRGNPLLVANRFQPQNQLIGPELFPVYRFVLKIFAFGYLMPYVLVWIGMMLFSPAFRIEQAHASGLGAIGSLISYLWIATCLVGCPVTAAFAILERMQERMHLFDCWSPRKLAHVRDLNHIPRTNSAFELGFGLIFIVWWIIYLHSPVVWIGPLAQITLSPQWPWLFWGYLLVALVNLTLAANKLMHPQWSEEKAVMRLFSDLAGSLLLCWLMKADLMAGFAAANTTPEQSLALTEAFNHWMRTIFPVAVALTLVVFATNVYRIVRLHRSQKRDSL